MWAFLLILVFFIGFGYIAIRSLTTFYYDERIDEVKSLARAYTRTLQSGIEAENQILAQMDKRLDVAAVTVSKYSEEYTDEAPHEMAKNLQVDSIYIFDKDLVITNNSDSENIGWQSTEGHQTYEFAHSDQEVFIEEIREGAITGTLYKYAYRKLGDGRIIQVSLRATTIEAIKERFSPQFLIDQIWHDAPVAKLLYLDENLTTIAATDSSLVGRVISLEGILDHSPNQHSYARTMWQGQPYLALNFPIEINQSSPRSLLIYYPVGTMETAIRHAAIFITIVMVVFFVISILLLNQTIQRNRRMYEFAYFDDETGLPNLHNFMTTLTRMRNTPVTAITIEISNLTQLVLSYGLEHSKRVHEEMANALRSLFANRIETNVFALPSSRFLVLFHSVKRMDTLSITDEIFLIRQQSDALANIDIRMGIALRSTEQIPSDILLKRALIALSAANHTEPVKQFSLALERELHRQDVIEETLNGVIEGNNEWLSLAFQPIVEIKERALVGFEALARLTCPVLGSVSPDEFISLAEQRHLIIALGWQILALACDTINEGLSRGREMVPIGINISVIQIMEESFVPTVAAIFNHKKIPHGLIQFELTESIFAQDLDFVSRQIDRLLELGVGLAIDDFGTGYSALSRINQFRFDAIKIPKQFTDHLDVQETADLVTDIISLAHHLGKEVIVEGVENEDQIEDLRLMKADYLQGYVISRPMPTADMFTYLEEATIVQKRFRHLKPNLQILPAE